MKFSKRLNLFYIFDIKSNFFFTQKNCTHVVPCVLYFTQSFFVTFSISNYIFFSRVRIPFILQKFHIAEKFTQFRPFFCDFFRDLTQKPEGRYPKNGNDSYVRLDYNGVWPFSRCHGFFSASGPVDN